jgi:hypothetical protein
LELIVRWKGQLGGESTGFGFRLRIVVHDVL